MSFKRVNQLNKGSSQITWLSKYYFPIVFFQENNDKPTLKDISFEIEKVYCKWHSHLYNFAFELSCFSSYLTAVKVPILFVSLYQAGLCMVVGPVGSGKVILRVKTNYFKCIHYLLGSILSGHPNDSPISIYTTVLDPQSGER